MADENPPMISIPVEALSTDSEDGKKVTPEVGDEVTLSDVTGVLKKLDNGEAYVELKSVNGMPVEYEDMDEKSESKKPMDADSMRKMAEEYDSESED